MQATKPVTKPSKQRKMLYQAPDHIRYKHFAAPLSRELRASQKIKSIPVRSGDTVRVMRGDRKGFEGKIARIDRKNYRIYVEGLTREKVDGSTIFVHLHPSKVMITRLNLDDKWRKKILEKRKELRKKAEEIEAKAERTPEEVAKVKEEVTEEKVVAEEKPKAKKPRKRKRAVTKKVTAEKMEKEEEKKEAKPKTKRTRTKRKTIKKAEGET